jgi:hypothetical protein
MPDGDVMLLRAEAKRCLAASRKFAGAATRAGFPAAQRRHWKRALRELQQGLEVSASARADDLIAEAIADLDDALRASGLLDRETAEDAARLRHEAGLAYTNILDTPPGIIRLTSLLLLLSYGRGDVPAGEKTLRAYLARDERGEVVPDLRQPVFNLAELLQAAYENGYATLSATSLVGLREARHQQLSLVRARRSEA